MLAISRQCDYASRVILHLALLPAGGRTTAREIAEQRLVPKALVRRVVTHLSAANLIVTSRGSLGGISLARPPSEISLLDVVEAMEGPAVLNVCTEDPKFCPLMPACTVHEAWVAARQVLESHLRQVTFDRLAAGHGPTKQAHSLSVSDILISG